MARLKIDFKNDKELFNRFCKWLSRKGNAVLPNIFEGDILRFVSGPHIIVLKQFRDKPHYYCSDVPLFNNIFDEFVSGKTKKNPQATKKKKYKKWKPYLIHKYGQKCFICDEEYPSEELTVEHLLARTYGPNDHINNMCLACTDCNTKLDSLPVADKILFRDQKRREKYGRSYNHRNS